MGCFSGSGMTTELENSSVEHFLVEVKVLLQTEGGGAGLYLLTQFVENVIIF